MKIVSELGKELGPLFRVEVFTNKEPHNRFDCKIGGSLY